MSQVKMEYRARIVGVTGEKEGEGRINEVIVEMQREGWAYREIHYRSFEFQGIRHSALLMFEREVLSAQKVQSVNAQGGRS